MAGSTEQSWMEPSDDIKTILYIDAYDSFTCNIVDLLEETLKVVVTVIRIDTPLPEGLQTIAERYDAIVAGPGPGTPSDAKDIGHMKELWKLQGIPILGICLGFQSLCCEHGAAIERLPEPRHGRVVTFSHSASDIFRGLRDSFHVTLYHSLQVRLDHPLEKPGAFLDDESVCWSSSRRCGDLQPLAWYREENSSDGATLMAVRHRSKPFWGVQFHPESCKSDDTCRDLVLNWWADVQAFNTKHRESIDRRHADRCASSSPPEEDNTINVDEALKRCSSAGQRVLYRVCEQGTLTSARISEIVGVPQDPSVVLEVDSRYSIISVLSPGSWTLQYKLGNRTLRLANPGIPDDVVTLTANMRDVHELIRRVLNAKQAHGGNPDIPFWGGYLGYFSYETGTDLFDIPTSTQIDGEEANDVSLLWVERSVVVDKQMRKIYIQSLVEDDAKPEGWLDLMTRRLEEIPHTKPDARFYIPGSFEHDETLRHYDFERLFSEKQVDLALGSAKITKPDEQDYKKRIAQCQEYIRRGDSYELCLTAETKINIPQCTDAAERKLRSWILYQRLQRYNPARYSGYAGLGDTKIISSSPELFMRWDRNATFEMKPMKGTVKKTPDMTLEKATEILNTPKEMGENLMIADLIRHDMSSLCGSGNVEVVRAMEVEVHTLVYQLITHVRGFSRAHPPILREQHDHRQHLRSGNDHHALLECLPPGSMTGAPKKRSCEILERIEGRQRSIYSGAMGFFDVGGGGNFSVLIRTAFSLSSGKDGLETWRIGAGGAITALSTAQGEWYEMITKLDTVVAIFRPSKGLEAAQCRSHPSSPMFCCGCSDLATPASSDVAGYSSRLKPGDDSSSAGYGSSATSDSGADMPV